MVFNVMNVVLHCLLRFMYVMFLCKPALLACWVRHLGGSKTGVGTDLGDIMGFYFCVGGALAFECLSCGLLGVFRRPGANLFALL